MTRFILFFIRSVALTLSYILSTAAAAATLTFTLFLGNDAGWLQVDPLAAVGAGGFFVSMWLFIGQLAFWPSLIVIVIAEFARLSGLLLNLLFGGGIAVAVMVLLNQQGSGAEGLPYDTQQIWLAVLTAGFVAGLAHWLLAGYRAGRWMGPPKEELL